MTTISFSFNLQGKLLASIFPNTGGENGIALIFSYFSSHNLKRQAQEDFDKLLAQNEVYWLTRQRSGVWIFDLDRFRGAFPNLNLFSGAKGRSKVTLEYDVEEVEVFGKHEKRPILRILITEKELRNTGMWKWLFEECWRWEVVGVIASVILGLGATAMSLDQYVLAKILYCTGVMVPACKFLTWEEARATASKGQKISLFFIVFIIAAALILGCWKWTDLRNYQKHDGDIEQRVTSNDQFQASKIPAAVKNHEGNKHIHGSTLTLSGNDSVQGENKRRMIREQLAIFIADGWLYDGYARGVNLKEGQQWAPDYDKWQNSVIQFLTKNLDASYAEQFNRPEYGNLVPRKVDLYQGQGMSESIRAKNRYLQRVIDENK